jgi:hypothetical protein
MERREDSFPISGAAAAAGTSAVLVCRSCGGGRGVLMVQLIHCPLEEGARVLHMSIH